MTPNVVVDVGNSRIKWGRCASGAVVESASLPPEEPAEWEKQLESWQLAAADAWIVASVHPDHARRLTRWLDSRGANVHALDDWRDLPLHIDVDHPERVGMDRLLDAVAANSRRPADVPAVIVDAGSAITVDWIDERGVFGGGAIFPGFRLMAAALHDYTALLSLVEITQPVPAVPAKTTRDAMRAGIYWTAVGGIRAICAELAARSASVPRIFLTGGDGPLLAEALGPEVISWPLMTLEGMRVAAEALP